MDPVQPSDRSGRPPHRAGPRPTRPSALLALLAVLAAIVPACGDTAPGGGAAADEPAPRAPAGPRTVVLVSLDTLRPDRLGAYGGDPAVAPHLDALAAESVVFDQALAPAPWTLPSHMTMLTGLDPVAHGVRNESYALSRHVTTIAEALAGDGFATGAFTDGGFVSARYGFDHGFEVYADERDQEINGFRRVMPPALDWLAARDGEDVFLFLHTFDAHTPYDTAEASILERFRGRGSPDRPDDHGLHWLGHMHQQRMSGVASYDRMADVLNDYDAGVHQADVHLGDLFARLRESGRWDGALIIVTSDHGEAFFDHGLHIGHGLALKDVELRIPLVMKLPGGEAAGRRHAELVGLVDLARTIYDVVGLEAPAPTQGESLLALVRGRPRRTRWMLAASQNLRSWGLVWNDMKYVSPVGIKPMTIARNHIGPSEPPSRMEPLGLVEYTMRDGTTLHYDMDGDPLGVLEVMPSGEELYDRQSDPDERRNLAQLRPADVARLRAFLEQRLEASEALQRELAEKEATRPAGLDPAEQRVLQALGYLGTGDPEELRGVSPLMREWALEPREPLDMRGLVEGDRLAHRLRLRLAEGGTPGPSDRKAALLARDHYVRWWADHPKHERKVDWRIVALFGLCERAGFGFDENAFWDPSRRLGG